MKTNASSPQNIENYHEISTDEYQEIISSGKFIGVNKKKRNHPRVIMKDNGTVYKLYSKNKDGLFSTQRYYPLHLRFIRNTQRLQAMKVRVPAMKAYLYYRDMNLWILHYQAIPGEIVQRLADNNTALLEKTICYITSLHHQGIYYKAIHLENILYDDTEGFGLIDIEDIRYYSHPLGWWLRARNIVHLFKHRRRDFELITGYGVERFVDFYLAQANLSEKSAAKLKKFVLRRATPR